MRYAGDKKGVLVTKGKAGLGNFLLSVLGSIIYCHMTNRKLCVDWSEPMYSEDGKNIFPSVFVCKIEQIDISQVRDENIYPPIWRGNLSKRVDEIIRAYDPKYWDDEMDIYPKYSILLNKMNLEQETLVRWSYFDDFSRVFKQLGYNFYSEKLRLQVLRKVLAENIKLAQPIESELKKLSANLLGLETIGVHIRFTDLRGPYSIILNRLRKVAIKRKRATIFLATDNKKVELEIEAMFPGRVKKSGKLMPNDGTPIYEKYRTKQALKEALFDMYLLSKCTYLIFSSSSTFGLCAALLSTASKENVFNCLTMKQRCKNVVKTMFINIAPTIHSRFIAK